MPDTPLPPIAKPLTDAPERSYTLPARFYTDPAVFEREKEAIFYRTWHYVGHVAHFETPGDYVTLRIADQGIFVIRGKDGELRGFYNVCQHRAHELLQGAGNVKAVITCPYHAWAYDTAGALRTARNCEELPNFDKADFTLPQVRVEVFCGFVFVNLDEHAPALAEQAGDLADDIMSRFPDLEAMRPIETMDFGGPSMKAGWKVVVENYVECYHCGPAHPDFADITDLACYQMDTFGIWSRQLGPKAKPENSAYSFAPDAPLQSSAFWYLWPTTTFNTMPGKTEMIVLAVRPETPETTTFAGHVYSLDGELDRARYEYLCDVLGPEDAGLCESVQRGLKSRGYDQGRFAVDAARSGISEHAVHHFHKLVQQALGA